MLAVRAAVYEGKGSATVKSKIQLWSHFHCPSPNSEMSHWYLKLGVPQTKTICFPPAPLILVLVLYPYFWNATTLLSVSQACCACPFTLALITKSWWYFILPNFSVCLSLFHPHCHPRSQVSITSHLGDLISNIRGFPGDRTSRSQDICGLQPKHKADLVFHRPNSFPTPVKVKQNHSALPLSSLKPTVHYNELFQLVPWIASSLSARSSPTLFPLLRAEHAYPCSSHPGAHSYACLSGCSLFTTSSRMPPWTPVLLRRSCCMLLPAIISTSPIIPHSILWYNWLNALLSN